MRRFVLVGMVCAAVLVAPRVSASTQDGRDAAQAAFEFPRPKVLEPSVAFWRKVFGEYSEHQLVIHAMDYPHKVFTVLDYRKDAAAGADPAQLRRRQLQEDRATRARINDMLRRVHTLRATPDKMSREERAIFDLFSDINDPDIYLKVAGRTRAQRGLRERTNEALEISGKYLPYMEAIFSSYEMPLELTRLPLVESSFNVDAYSKVGASGMWQFMPASARIYMRLNEVVDDRRDPWFSTEAAARHLRDDYAMLKDWPLAVTAYNFGRAGLARALKAVEGSSLEDLLERYEGRRFGFASRNFYAEFLAAVDVEREHQTHFGPVQRREPLGFEVVETEHYVPFETLRRISEADAEMFRTLNPAYRPEVVQGKLFVPPRHPIKVPAGRAEAFRASYAALSDAERFDRQREYWIHHRVARGETMGAIARRYSSSVRAIQQANGISNPHRLRAGQVIKIPPRDVPGTQAVAYTRPAAAQAADLPYRLHRVQAGQTLSAISRRYGVPVNDIVAANQIGNAHSIRAGELIRIPVR